MNARSPRAPLALALLLAIACEGAERDRIMPDLTTVDGVEIASLQSMPDMLDPSHLWSFEVVQELQTVSGPDAEPVVFDPSAAYELDDGTLLVNDPTADRPLVHLDPADGSVLARFGRRGQGPGEIAGWLTFAEDGDALVALDAPNRRIHRFAMAGGAMTNTPFTIEAFGREAELAPGGDAFLFQTVHSYEDGWHNQLERIGLASGGVVTDFIRLPEPSPGAQAGRIQQGRALWTVAGEHVLTMWSDRPVVYVHGGDGALLREIHLPMTRRTITERDIQEQIEVHGAIANGLRVGTAALTNMMYAASDSVFALLTTDLWKAEEDPDLPVGEIWWRMFTVRGEYVGVVQVPDGFQPLATGRGTIWAEVLNESSYPVIQELELRRADGRAR